MFKNLSIRVKISTIFTLVIFVVCIFIFTYFPAKQKNQVMSALQNKAESTLNIMAAGVTFAFGETDYDFVNRLFTLVKNDSGILYIAILDEDGNQQIGYNPQKIATPVITSRSANKTFEDDGMLYTFCTIDLEDGFVTLIMGFSLQDRDKQIADIRWTGLAVSITIFIACIIISIYLSKLITDPIQRVITTIKDITRTEKYGDSIEKSRDDEVGALIDSFNKMGKRIQTRTSELEYSQAELNELNQQLLNNQKELSAANQQLNAGIQQLQAQEDILRESEERFRTLVENAPEALVVLDVEKGSFVQVTENACQLFKMTKEELLKIGFAELSPPTQPDGRPSPEAAMEAIGQALNGEKPVFEWVHRDSEGKDIPCEVRLVRMPSADRKLVRGSLTDISLRREAEESLKKLNQQLLNHQKELSAANQQLTASFEQLKANEIALIESEERIRLIIDSAQDAVITMDEKSLITEWNAKAEKIFGWSRKEVIRKNLADKILPEQFREAHAKGLERYFATGEGSVLSQRREIQALHRDGHEFQVELTITPLKVGNSTIFSCFIRDITQQKKAEKELKAAKESAESANQELRNTNQHLEQATLLAKEMAMQAEMASGAKSEFLANMSHEIRTPLNSMIGMTELTLETQLNSEQRGYLNVVQSSSEGLLSLINDILDFSKIEAGQMELEHIELNLREVVEGVAEMLGTRANAKGVEMLCYIDAEIPSWLVGDPTRLRQILINLTGNSIKFTEQGDVAIKVKFRKQNDNAVELHFKVSDTGIGISPENIKKIFEKFSQADTSTTRKFGGTGLGLNISKSLVEMMGGELWVESQEGKGSKFQFKIRLPIGQRTDDDFQQSYPDFKTTHVIVVDDNETNRFILRKMLENWEFQVTEAQSGSQALSILKNSKNPISLALLDQKMPEMDGLELAQKIREDEAFKDMKLIMLSSLVSYDREFIKKMGIAASILKPIRQKTLFNALLKVLTERRHDDSADQHNKISEQIEKTISGNILLVEDNPSNQKLAKKILVKRGYHVDIAENGRLAVEAFTRFRHDLILMDIYMPEMDGFEATHEIRTRESEYMEARIPIIALTAHAIEGYREKCFENNMDDFVTKPINKKILFETIEKWLDSRPTVLVVDDSIDNRNLVIHHLRKTGDYQLVTAKNGQEAVDIFRRRPVSLVLMDMEMPVMDGRTATRRIRAFKNGTDVPIIALTAHNDKKHLDQAFDAGCTSYLGKPLRKAKLLECLDKHLY
ncbi:response regulator [candidate division KSB1 bacterium]|nr:response regulator [candidate division KSB1 bacterium]